MNHNWSARKQRFHPQSVAEIATIQFIWWNTNNTLLKGVISNDLQRHWVNCWFSYSVLKQEVWPLGFSDTVCPRPPLKTQVQHFISRIKKRQRWSVQMMWAYDLDLWPWRSPRLSVIRVFVRVPSANFGDTTTIRFRFMGHWANAAHTDRVILRPWSLTLEVMAPVADAGRRPPYIYQVWSS